jgi:pyruvate carboxylase subunit B
MYKVKKAQGTDITRIFCGLNDPRNIIPSIKYALEAGMIPQAALCITHSPIHTVEYYTDLAEQLIAAGATEIALKDMAGIGRPKMLGQLVKNIKARHPEVIVQYHGTQAPASPWPPSSRYARMVPISSTPPSNPCHGVRYTRTSSPCRLCSKMPASRCPTST